MKYQQNLPEFLSIKHFNRHENSNSCSSRNRHLLGDRNQRLCLLKIHYYHSIISIS